MAEITQEEQVINVIAALGGYATLRRIYEVVDFSKWGTKTPEASVRRIVQNSICIFKIQPGLWGLEKYRDRILNKLKLNIGDKQSEEQFSHGYYQGLLIEIGKLSGKNTYIPPQDKRRLFLGKELGEIADFTVIPPFTRDDLLKRAKTVDVVWFNQRRMPSHFYEVEHTTDIKNSLSKFYELQDFNAAFCIVASDSRKNEFEDKIQSSIFDEIRERVSFIDYERVAKRYTSLKEGNKFIW